MGGLMSMFAPVWEKLIGKDEFRIIMVGLDVSFSYFGWHFDPGYGRYSPDCRSRRSFSWYRSTFVHVVTVGHYDDSFSSNELHTYPRCMPPSSILLISTLLFLSFCLLMLMLPFCLRPPGKPPCCIVSNWVKSRYARCGLTFTYELICTRRCWYHSLFSQLELVLSSVAEHRSDDWIQCRNRRVQQHILHCMGCRWSRKGK